MKRLALAALAIALLGAATPDLFRFSRPVIAQSGWARVPLPDDLLDACRPGLPDIRLRDGAGKEVPWALEERIGRSPARLPLRDVERTSHRETTAVLDRGARPALARTATLEIDGQEFLKPVVIDSSDDGASWKAFAEGSVFAGRHVRSTTLRFAPNGRRWWRFRFDDRNSDPVGPRAVSVDAGDPPRSVREVPLSPGPPDASSPGVSLRTLTLPAANLGVASLRISGAAPAYVRAVRVTERVLHRDEVVRRLVGAGTITRAPDGSGSDEIALCDASARLLELEIEETGGPAFEVSSVVALARSRSIVFATPRDAAGLRLFYGSGIAETPGYDIERALSIARPGRTSEARLGPAERRAGDADGLAVPLRGATVAPAAWKAQQPIALPDQTSVAYLDLPAAASANTAPVRVLDSENRPVPYIVERVAHRQRHPVPATTIQRETKTVLRIETPQPSAIDLVEVSAAGPAYFSRRAAVTEDERDARGVTDRRVLGSASWVKRAEEPAVPLAIPIGRPSAPRIEVEIENGDNAPLTLASAAVWTSAVRIDFVFQPGEKLRLAWDNPDATPPRFDLELVADRILSAPARPARLALLPARPSEKTARTPGVLWIAIAAAGVLLLVVLARTLKAPA
ncbi:MAG: DUF3999 domain-containing protein [Acidobacteriota bacterium]|nr:DUF3999 domain-containing protein [Acidobacteriota bacterium]